MKRTTTKLEGALPWASEEEAHGRHIIVSRSVDTRCRFCDSPEAIEVDTSEGEYLSFKCCAPCFARMAASKFGDEVELP